MTAKVRYADISKFDRVIAISDIHGDLAGYRGLLKQLRFSDRDLLVIVGDILEKGPESLAVLQTLTKACKSTDNIIVLCGNNDAIFTDWYKEDAPNDAVLRYLNAVKHTTIREMAEEMQMPLETCQDLEKIKEAIPKHFPEEFEFIMNLPDILETDLATFVHAGLKPGDLEGQDRDFCLSAPAFAAISIHRFEKPLVVGHWPCSNYCDKIINASVYYNADTNVWSLDGGNSMKKWQQINYLIFKQGEIHAGYYDNLPKIRALEPQLETRDPMTVIFPNTELEVLERGADVSLCHFPKIHLKRPISTESIYEYKGKLYCSDFTTYCLGVEAGEILSFCDTTAEGILVKRNDIVGNYHGKFEYL